MGGNQRARMIRIHPHDNVAVALAPMEKGVSLSAGGDGLIAEELIRQGHKVALCPIPAGGEIIKYGYPIGHAAQAIAPGEWVHTHNMVTDLSKETQYSYEPNQQELTVKEPETFPGYLRPDGRAGIRNELWIIPVVGCVNGVAERLAMEYGEMARARGLDGVCAFPHPYGCSQAGDDHETTKRLLAALTNHPNAGGVLVTALGCENVTLEQFKAALGDYDQNRIRFLVCQKVKDELVVGRVFLEELASYAESFHRRPIPASKLVVGMKCGGSDGLSGITANPVVGAFSDLLVAMGGSAILTEVPEMFGAEAILMKRAETRQVFDKTVAMIDSFKRYFTSHGQVIYENPSPGNKEGGITTLEDKSLGCVQKAGSATIRDVIDYGEQLKVPGLTLLSGPGNDLVSATALAAAGAHMILFTTGRGTPFGTLAPTLKIASNSELAGLKRGWIDFDAGSVAKGGETIQQAAERLLKLVLEVAGGKLTQAERAGYRGIAIFKNGVIL